MNLLFYSPQTLPSIGGLQYVVHYWAEALQNRGHKVVVLSETAGAANQTNAYPVYENAGFSEKRKWLARSDVLLCFDISLKGLPFWLGSGKPLIISHQSGLWYEDSAMPFRQRMKRSVANRLATQNLACSHFIAKYYKNTTVIYNPVRQDVFVPAAENIREPDTLLFSGRLVTDKGGDLLLEALALLRQKHPHRNFRLWIVGDGPEKEALQQQAKNGHLEKAVDFLGFLSQEALVKKMHRCAVMVVPSRMEPMGMIAAEGLAAGCTMVLADYGGLPEVGGEFCHYFKTGNAVSLSEAIGEAFLSPVVIPPRDLQHHLAQFSIDYSVKSLLQVLKTATGKP